MPMTAAKQGRASSTPPTPGKPARLSALLEQLDDEWNLHQLDTQSNSSPDERARVTYFHTCIRPALHWVDGDPTKFRCPPEFEGQRLAKAVVFLRGLADADQQQQRQARERYAARARALWPEYAALCTTYSDELEETLWGYRWDGLDTLWHPLDVLAPLGPEERERTAYLPQFSVAISEEWHLCVLVLCFCNRWCGLKLSDLNPYGWADQ